VNNGDEPREDARVECLRTRHAAFRGDRRRPMRQIEFRDEFPNGPGRMTRCEHLFERFTPHYILIAMRNSDFRVHLILLGGEAGGYHIRTGINSQPVRERTRVSIHVAKAAKVPPSRGSRGDIATCLTAGSSSALALRCLRCLLFDSCLHRNGKAFWNRSERRKQRFLRWLSPAAGSQPFRAIRSCRSFGFRI
jgi:hypothetical protein